MKTIDDEIKFLQNGVPYADTKTQLDEQAKLAKQAISQLIQEAIPDNPYDKKDYPHQYYGYNQAIKDFTKRLKERGLLLDNAKDRDGASSTLDNTLKST